MAAGRQPLWRRVAPVLVSLALVAAVLATVDATSLLHRLATMGPGWLVAAAALGPAQVALGGWRWARVSRGLGLPLDNVPAIAEYALSTGLNQLLPSGVAGDAVRVWRQRHQHGLGLATHAAVVDRALGLATLLAVTTLSLPLWPAAGGMTRLVAVSVLVLGGGGLLISPVAGATRDLLRRDGLAQVGASLLLTVSFVVGFGLAGLAVGVPPDRWLLTGVPWLLLAMAVPLSFAGWGVREASAALVWPWLGRSPEEGVAVAAVYGLSVLLGALPGLLFWGWYHPEEAS
jgi:hypothetical protein